MAIKLPKHEHRTWEQLQQHYDVEKELAGRLRRATREERRDLYTAVYDELFCRVPLHPQLTRKLSATSVAAYAATQMRLLHHFLQPNDTFLEVGAGDCSLSLVVAQSVKYVYAVDVSPLIAQHSIQPSNFELIISNGTSIPAPSSSVTVAYSNQLMEHLHPEDALEQLSELFRVLRPGGTYICITPNALKGPSDISKYFDRVPSGFHLKEYTITELGALFTQVGFSRVRAYVLVKGRAFSVPLLPITIAENLLARLPHAVKRRVARMPIMSKLLGIVLAGTK